VAKRSAETNRIASLAQAIRSVDARSLTPAAIEQAKLLLLDTIGCGFAGRSQPAAQAALSAFSRSNGDSAVIGQATRTSMLDAVFLNGLLVRVLDLNDYIIGEAHGEPESAGHPSDNIPVALAAGEARHRSGREILAAIVVSYELYARLQQAMDRAGRWDGVTASGLVAPAVAGWLMALTEEQLGHALALGAARAATPSIVRTGDISAAKSLANALVAQSGVQAALLAEKGATGPIAILNDARGLRDLFARVDSGALCAPFPPDGAIMRAHVKAYPCINTGQSAVAAALKLHAMTSGNASALSRIEVTMADYKVTKRHQEDPERLHPASREAADHSFSFIVAAALLDGQFGPAQFERERWRDPTVTSLMSKIVLRRDAAWNTRAPGSYPCSIRAIDAHGHEHHVEVPYPPGYSRDGLEANIVLDKFHAVTDSILARAERTRIVDAVMGFDRHESATTLSRAIAIEGKST
jgi:2-methylcitrate dehydratase